jgi:hypothetical protein
MDLVNDKLSTMEQIRLSYRGLGQSSARMAKGFSKVGIFYSATECFIEQERGCHDINNAM